MGITRDDFWKFPYHEVKELEHIAEKYNKKEKDELESQTQGMKMKSQMKAPHIKV